MSDQKDGPTEGTAKGRATPSRREAEAARKARMKTPLTRKEQARRTRAARDEVRRKQQEGIRAGDDRYLPARDQGPVRRWVRDYVDARWNIAEFLLPVLLTILVLSITIPRLANALWAATILMVIFDSIILLRGVRRGLTATFGPDEVKGQRFYAFLRSTQFRRFRLPKPGVARGEAPRQK